MSASNPNWSIKLTHEPTGISITVTGKNFRTMRAGHESAMKYLKNRVFAHTYGSYPLQDSVISCTILPDEEPCPHELSDFRKYVDGQSA